MESVEQERVRVGQRPNAGRLVETQGRINRSVAAMLDLIAELDTVEARAANLVTDMASWLQYDLGLEAKTARAWVRVAGVLPELPMTSRAFMAGAVSFDEVRILCRYATPDNEQELLALTRNTEVKDLTGAIRELLAIETKRPKPPEENPWLEMFWDRDETFLTLRGQIPGADGVLVETALLRAAAQQPLDPASGLYRSADVRTAEALVQMASDYSATEADHDRATVVVHFKASDLVSASTSGLAGSRFLDPDELLRVSCDARIQPAIDDPSGVTVGVGRTSRKIPAWLRRLVDGRDGGCRFPGCGRTRWTNSHHIIHWAHGGPTNLDNLITLCGFHHRLIHRKRWQVTGIPSGEVSFLDQWGNEYRPARRLFDPAHTQRLLESIDRYENRMLDRQLATANSPP